VSFQGLSGKARSFRSVSNEPETCVHGRRPVTLRTSCKVIWFASLVAWYIIRHPFERRARKVATISSAELARIRQEERMMLERFGADYRDYMASTKRLVPWSL